MKLKKLFEKALSVLLAFSFCFCLVNIPGEGLAEVSLSTEEQKAALEARIKETNEKLDQLKSQTGETKEYLTALNDKISYLEEEIDLVEREVEENESAAAALRVKYTEIETALEKAQAEYEALEADFAQKTAQFEENYGLFCGRMRAIYISGETNILTLLLTSGDISDFLTRYEMIKRISAQDGQLLEELETEMDNIMAAKVKIEEKSAELESKKPELDAAQQQLEDSLSALEAKETELGEKETALEGQKAEANVLLKKLNDETGYYTEFLENDEETLKEIDDEIAAAAAQYRASLSTTTTASGEETTSGKTAATTTATTKAASSKYISLTYPVPSQTKITCAWQEYTGHSGADFSCPTGSKVVAAESGYVLISKDLTNSDGSYRSYGRYIVIMHDKTTASGAAVYTLYGHNSQRLVTAGQYVEKGQAIALSGSTGNSTGPHLHFEVRTPTSSYSDCKNPVDYLP